MSKEGILKLTQTLNEALQTLDDLRLKAGCETFPSLSAAADDHRRGKMRNHDAYQVAVLCYNNRRARSVFFGERDIFGEPAWDILLDLYIRQAKHEDVSVKSATIGSGVPATTALRWLGVLEGQNLIRSEDDPDDSRRRLLHLTAEGRDIMTRYLEQIAG